MDHELFCEWLQKAVIPHKQQVNPDGINNIILDNHGSRFSKGIAVGQCFSGEVPNLFKKNNILMIESDVSFDKKAQIDFDSFIKYIKSFSASSEERCSIAAG